jgi:hypothetical protein
MAGMGEPNTQLLTSDPTLVRDIAAAHPEVEFALVLARTIDSLSSDPELLRSTVYALARQKLQELARDPLEKTRLTNALEIAIAGVEAHKKNVKMAPPSIGGQVQKLNYHNATRITGGRSTEREVPEWLLPTDLPSDEYEVPPRMIESAVSRVDAAATTISRTYGLRSYAPTSSNQPRAFRWLSSMALRYAAVLAFFGIIAGVLLAERNGVSWGQLRNAEVTSWFGGARGSKQLAAKVTEETSAASRPARAEPKPQRRLPPAYGIFAESGGKLFELQALQGRAPDIRVAISAAITNPSETVLPDGHLKFIVYQRDTKSGDGSGTVDVRIVARVKQETAYDSSGKGVTTASENVWAIRNISIPFRAAPMKEEHDMYDVGPRDADEVLSPGRYALILKGAAYDFTVDGKVTDKRHCLERLLAANGVFYSECPNLDAAIPATTAPIPRR